MLAGVEPAAVEEPEQEAAAPAEEAPASECESDASSEEEVGPAVEPSTTAAPPPSFLTWVAELVCRISSGLNVFSKNRWQGLSNLMRSTFSLKQS